jgi:hypothetical protein
MSLPQDHQPRTISLPDSPDVQLLGGSVALLKGSAALDAYRLLVEGIATVRRRDGIEPPPRLMQTVATLKAAADAARRPAADRSDIADVRNKPTSPVLVSGELMGIEEVAQMFGVGHRQARRLAPSVGGHKKRSGGWVFDRGLVQAYIDAEGQR